MFFKYFSRHILFSRTFQDSLVYLSTFQACVNPGIQRVYFIILAGLCSLEGWIELYLVTNVKDKFSGNKDPVRRDL